MRKIFYLFAAVAFIATALGAAPPQSVQPWPSKPIDDHVRGGVSAVAVGPDDKVYLFHRAGRIWNEDTPDTLISQPTVLVLDGGTGRVLRAWGENRFVVPHGLTVDSGGNMWVTDVKLHQVFKFSPRGKLLLELGTPYTPGSDASHFNGPTDVAVRPDGSFYVSDGYGNSRVMKFSRNGRFQFEWGGRGTSPGQFTVPHALDIDRKGRVYVADRENARVQVFDGDGKLLAAWSSHPLSKPFAVASIDGRTYVGGQDSEPGRQGGPIRLLEFHEGKLVSAAAAPSARQRSSHDLAVSKSGDIYVVGGWPHGVEKFARTP